MSKSEPKKSRRERADEIEAKLRRHPGFEPDAAKAEPDTTEVTFARKFFGRRKK